MVIQKLNAEGRLEKKEAKKGSAFDKVLIKCLIMVVEESRSGIYVCVA